LKIPLRSRSSHGLHGRLVSHALPTLVKWLVAAWLPAASRRC